MNKSLTGSIARIQFLQAGGRECSAASRPHLAGTGPLGRPQPPARNARSRCLPASERSAADGRCDVAAGGDGAAAPALASPPLVRVKRVRTAKQPGENKGYLALKSGLPHNRPKGAIWPARAPAVTQADPTPDGALAFSLTFFAREGPAAGGSSGRAAPPPALRPASVTRRKR